MKLAGSAIPAWCDLCPLRSGSCGPTLLAADSAAPPRLPPPRPCPLQQMASDSLVGNRTLGGRPPVVVHFTRHKPFRGPQPGRPGHQFLCSLEEVEGER